MTIHVNYGPQMREACREPWGTRWCFKCRKRLMQWAVMYTPVGESYYGSHWSVECERCGENHVHFPGCEPDGPTLMTS